MLFGQVVGSCQTMAAAADNNHIVFAFWLRFAPGILPMTIVAEGIPDEV
jgi:hypothetical protein